MENVEVTANRCRDKFNEFEGIVSVLKLVEDQSKTWTDNTFLDLYKFNRAKIYEANRLVGEFETTIAALKRVREHEVKSAGSKRRKTDLHNHRHCKSVVADGLWPTALQWVASNVLKPDSDGKWAPETMSKFAFDPKAHDWSTPGPFNQADDVGKTVFELTTIYAAELKAATTLLEKDFAGSENKTNLVKLTGARDPHKKQLEEKKWMPIVTIGGVVIDDAMGLGTHSIPMLLGSLQGGVRLDKAKIPFIGFPSWYLVQAGSVAIVLFPMQATLDAGSTIDQVQAMLAGLDQKDLTAFLTANCSVFYLTTGSAMWVPTGFHVLIIGCEGPSIMMHMPIHSHKALKAVGEALRLPIAALNKDHISMNSTVIPWKHIAKHFAHWLDDPSQA